MIVFKILYWVGLIVEGFVRAPYRKSMKSAQKTERRVTVTDRVMLGLMAVSGFILPLIYTLTPWLDFANYRLPLWMGWSGVLFLVAAVYLFVRAHLDLRSNWSISLEIYEQHTLVTTGIYSVIRHPMYASQWLMVIAQALLLQNWLAGPVGALVFIPFYFLRVSAEEKMMLDTFGDQYRKYMQRVGGVIPKR